MYHETLLLFFFGRSTQREREGSGELTTDNGIFISMTMLQHDNYVYKASDQLPQLLVKLWTEERILVFYHSTEKTTLIHKFTIFVDVTFIKSI